MYILPSLEQTVGVLDQAAPLQGREAMPPRLAILVNRPDIGGTTAPSTLIEMAEPGTLDGKQAASLAGLDVHPCFRATGRWNPDLAEGTGYEAIEVRRREDHRGGAGA